MLYEAGEALRFDPRVIQTGVEGILRVMSLLEMIALSVPSPAIAPREITSTKWVRAACSGILHTDITLGQRVAKKQKLGFVADAFGDKPVKITAPCDGIVIGSTQNPLVSQGDGIFHIAVCLDEPEPLDGLAEEGYVAVSRGK